jgi:hypothetical protein
MKCNVAGIFLAIASNSVSSSPSKDLASAFLGTLNHSQKTKAMMSFDSDSRTSWMYVPGNRVGITLKEMSENQREAGMDLLKSSLSESGFKKVESIRADLEATLRQMEQNLGRDPEQYFFAFFGEPKANGKWGWRFEGHHVSLSFTYQDGKLVATTPQFLGSNPARIPEGPHKDLRVLGKEEDLGRQFVNTLSSEQKRLAIVGKTAPPDIVTSNQRDVGVLEDKGLEFTELSKSQAKAMKEIVGLFADVQRPEQAKARLDKIESAGWANVRFAWMGSIKPGFGQYYRIQGPTFLIEYDNTQNNANHVHTVWRDFKGDFGRDVLLDHYQASNHHRRDNRDSSSR